MRHCIAFVVPSTRIRFFDHTLQCALALVAISGGRADSSGPNCRQEQDCESCCDDVMDQCFHYCNTVYGGPRDLCETEYCLTQVSVFSQQFVYMYNTWVMKVSTDSIKIIQHIIGDARWKTYTRQQKKNTSRINSPLQQKCVTFHVTKRIPFVMSDVRKI